MIFSYFEGNIVFMKKEKNLKARFTALLLAAGFTVSGVMNPPDALTDDKITNIPAPAPIVEVLQGLDSPDMDLPGEGTEEEEKGARKALRRFYYGLPRLVRILAPVLLFIVICVGIAAVCAALEPALSGIAVRLIRWALIGAAALLCGAAVIKGINPEVKLGDIINRKNGIIFIAGALILGAVEIGVYAGGGSETAIKIIRAAGYTGLLSGPVIAAYIEKKRP